MHAAVILLRLIHVLSAIFWVGTLLFTTFFLFPATSAAGPGAGPVMGALRERGLLLVMPVTAALTILSGAALMWIASAGDMAAYTASPTGRAFSISGGLAILGFLIGMVTVRPAGGRLMQLVPEANTISDGVARAAVQAGVKRLQRRVAVMSGIVTTLIILATAGMSVARYMS